MIRSQNCENSYTSSISTFVSADVTVPGDEKCTLNSGGVFSCQSKDFETPDAQTRESIKDIVVPQLRARGCDVNKAKYSYKVNLMGSVNREYPAEKLKQLGLTSSCFAADNDINDASHYVGARCYPLGEVTDINTGNTLKMYNRVFEAKLATCSLTDDAQAEKDLKNVIAHNMQESGFELESLNDLSCSFYTLPRW